MQVQTPCVKHGDHNEKDDEVLPEAEIPAAIFHRKKEFTIRKLFMLILKISPKHPLLSFSTATTKLIYE